VQVRTPNTLGSVRVPTCEAGLSQRILACRRRRVAGAGEVHELLGLLGGEVVEHHHLAAVEDGERRPLISRRLLPLPLLLVFQRASLLREELQHGLPLLRPLLRRRRRGVGYRRKAHGHGRREAQGAVPALLLHVLAQQAARHREPAAAGGLAAGLLLLLLGGGHVPHRLDDDDRGRRRTIEANQLTSTSDS